MIFTRKGFWIAKTISDTKLNWLKELFEKGMENENKYVFQLN